MPEDALILRLPAQHIPVLALTCNSLVRVVPSAIAQGSYTGLAKVWALIVIECLYVRGSLLNAIEVSIWSGQFPQRVQCHTI